MAKGIVTQDAVVQAAQALVASGAEPTIIRVQERIGGGSYTTVSRYLEVWRAEGQQALESVVVPDAVAAKGSEFVRVLWAHAAALAEEQTRLLREEAAHHVTQTRAALAEAEATIARLEAEAEAQEQELLTALRSVEAVQRDLVTTQSAHQVAEARAHAGERRAEELRAELSQARNAEHQLARLEGENQALGRQVAEQTALIERLSMPRSSAAVQRPP